MTATTSIHLTPAERAALNAAAEASGLGPSSYARRAVMQSVGRETSVHRRPDGTAQAIGRALGDLGRVGNVVNQLARHAHQGGRVPADALASVRLELSGLTAAVLALREPGR